MAHVKASLTVLVIVDLLGLGVMLHPAGVVRRAGPMELLREGE
jgi:hypothetical protein